MHWLILVIIAIVLLAALIIAAYRWDMKLMAHQRDLGRARGLAEDYGSSLVGWVRQSWVPLCLRLRIMVHEGNGRYEFYPTEFNEFEFVDSIDEALRYVERPFDGLREIPPPSVTLRRRTPLAVGSTIFKPEVELTISPTRGGLVEVWAAHMPRSTAVYIPMVETEKIIELCRNLLDTPPIKPPARNDILHS